MNSSLQALHAQNEQFFSLYTKKHGALPFTQDVYKKLCLPNLDFSSIFQEQKVLGKGKSGKVTLVEDPQQQRFAIKECHTLSSITKLLCDSLEESDEVPEEQEILHHFFDDDGVTKTGKREFEKSLQLEHPAVVKIYGLFVKVHNNEKVTRLILEYLEGKELGDIEEGTLTRKEVLKDLDPLLDALLHSLDRGLIPTDLNSSNVIKTSQDCRLIDFEGYETFEEAENTESEDGTLQDRLEEVFSLCKSFLEKSSFSQVEHQILEDFKANYLANEERQTCLQETTCKKNIPILSEFIEGIRKCVRSITA